MGKQLCFLAELDASSYPLFAAAAQAVRDLGIADRQTPGLPPHITLASCSLQLEGEALARLDTLGRETRPGALRFDSIGLFGLRVAFCAPVPGRELLALHRRAALREEGPWTPHATLLITEREEEMLRALPVLTKIMGPFGTCITAVSLWGFGRPGSWDGECWKSEKRERIFAKYLAKFSPLCYNNNK